MSVVFQNAIVKTYEGDLDWETATLHALLLMTNTTADTNPDADTCADLTLDECDATNYVEETVTNPAVSVDNTDNEMVWTSDNWVWGDGTALGGNGTRDYQGALLIQYVNGSTGDIPMLFADFSSDIPKAATQVTALAPAEGFYNSGQPA